MCVIVHQPADAYLSRNTAEQMWKRNPDGGGYAFIDNEGLIQIGKAMNFDKFWSMFETSRSGNRDKDFLVHFRIATSGKVGIPNTHPFEVDDYTVMAHNGMLNHITGPISIKDELSDTRVFINDVLTQLPDNWLDNPVLVDMVEDYIGGSKLMFLTVNPLLKENIYILNKNKGVQRNRMWWSNDHHAPRYQPAKGVTYTSGKTPQTTVPAQSGSRIMANRKPADSAGTTSVPVQKEEKKDNIYKLPLPNTTAADACERPTQAEVEAFWLSTEADKLLNYSVLPEDTDQAAEAIRRLRKEMGLSEDFLFDPTMEEYECQTCYNYINDRTGDCRCWDMICVGCGAMAPYCVHDPEDREFVELADAVKAFGEKEAIIKGKETIEA